MQISIMQVYTHTLQKARRITESHRGIPHCVELCKVYAFRFMWN